MGNYGNKYYIKDELSWKIILVLMRHFKRDGTQGKCIWFQGNIFIIILRFIR